MEFLRGQKSTHVSKVNWFLIRVPRPFTEEKYSLFNKWCWDNWALPSKRVNPDPHLTSYKKINSTLIKQQYLKAKTLKLLQGNNIVENVHDPELGNGFLDMTPKHKKLKKT